MIIFYFFIFLSAAFYQQSFWTYLSPVLLLMIVNVLLLLWSVRYIRIKRVDLLVLAIPLIPFTGSLYALLVDGRFFADSVFTLIHRSAYTFLAFSLFLYTRLTQRSLYKLSRTMLLLILATIVIQYIQYFSFGYISGLEPTHPSFAGGMGSVSQKTELGLLAQHGFRAYSIFAEPGDAGMFAVFIGVPFLGLAELSLRRKNILLLLLWLVAGLTKSMNPLLVLGIITLYYLKREKILFKYSIVLIIISVAFVLFSPLIMERLTKIADKKDPSLSTRITSIQAALHYQSHDPLSYVFGLGSGNNAKFPGKSDFSVKSDYFRLLFDGGLVAVGLYLMILYALWKYGRSKSPLRFFIIALMLMGILGDTQALYYLPVFIFMALRLTDLPYRRSELVQMSTE